MLSVMGAAKEEQVGYIGTDEAVLLVTADGKDITKIVEKTAAWLTEHSF